MNKIRVLVFPCGSECAAEIHQALRYSLHVELYGASSVEDHGRFRFQRYIGGIPNISDSEFDQAWMKLISELNIHMVFATHDSVQTYLANRAAAMGFYLVNGHPQTCAIARRKSLTYQILEEFEWIPEVYSNVTEVRDWPALVKPDCGQGGQGITIVDDVYQAKIYMDNLIDPILTEYLPGQELTVDCFTDSCRELVWVGPRTRERVRAGITMRSNLLELTLEIKNIAQNINNKLIMRGPWFFQIKRDRNEVWKLLEIGCRPASTTTAQRAHGVNLPLMAVQDYLGRRLKALPNPKIKMIDRNIATRSVIDFDYESVYIDLDDTIIIDGKVVPHVIAFIYQEISKNKKIILITRHAFDVVETLQQVHISVTLFDHIIHLRNNELKSDYVSEKSIFIDNHFPERLDVATSKLVPVLDVDAIEFFLN